MSEFTVLQAERLISAFDRVAESLTRASNALDPARLESTFAAYVDDVTPMQRRLLADWAERVRATMRVILERHKLTTPQPNQSALRAARSEVNRAIVATERLGPQYMRAYGEVSDVLEAELNCLVSQLLGLLEQIQRHLERGSSEEVPEHLRQVSSRRPTPLLYELGRIIRAYGLSNLRPTLEALVERLASDTLEIATYGQTNAGKSSLLNHLLETDALPVGALPVTVVPIQLSYGAKALGYAAFADAAPDVFVASRLAEFAASHFNPDNARHVIRLRVRVPSPRLKDGIVAVDMPGLDLRGAEVQSYIDELHCRCDIGLVAVDATGSLTLEDITVVDALYRSGSRALVLLTKADRLSSQERWQIHGLVAHALLGAIGVEVPVYMVSTNSTDTALTNYWIEHGLEPLLKDRLELRRVSLARKVDSLRRATVIALEQRIRPVSAASAANVAETELVLAEAQAMVASATAQQFDPRTEAIRQCAVVIDDVANNAAVLWPHSVEPSLDVTTILRTALQARAEGVAMTLSKSVRSLTARCWNALAATDEVLGNWNDDMTVRLAQEPLPRFDSARYVERRVLPQPAFTFLGRWRRSAAVKKALARGPLEEVFGEALRKYFGQVDEWRARALQLMAQSLSAASSELRARHAEPNAAVLKGPLPQQEAIAEDIAKLRQWRADLERQPDAPEAARAGVPTRNK